MREENDDQSIVKAAETIIMSHSGVFKIHQEPDWLTKRLSKDGLFGHSTVDEQIKVLIFSVKHSVKIVYSLPNAEI